jgi:hypothetical protein
MMGVLIVKKRWKLSREMTVDIFQDGSMLCHTTDGRYRLTDKEVRALYIRLFYQFRKEREP